MNGNDEDEDNMPLFSALKLSKNVKYPKKSKQSDDISPQKRNWNKSSGKSNKDDDEKVAVPTLHQHTLSSAELTITPSNSNNESDHNSSSSHHS